MTRDTISPPVGRADTNELPAVHPMVDISADAGEQMIVQLQAILAAAQADPASDPAEALSQLAKVLSGAEAAQIAKTVAERAKVVDGRKSVNFTPRRGQILLCDFDMAGVPPEMRKVRRVVVVSPKAYNAPGAVTRDGQAPGKVIVVPLSATEPRAPRASHVAIPVGQYRALTAPVWAICEMVDHVSHNRLTRVQESGQFLTESMNADDMDAIGEALKHAQGLLPAPIAT